MREQEMRRRKALGLLEEDRVEPESNPREFWCESAETDGHDSTSLCDEVFSKENIERAIYLVCKNKGAPGIDGMTVYELEDWWKENGAAQEGFIRNLHYRPKPVRRVDNTSDAQSCKCNRRSGKSGSSHPKLLDMQRTFSTGCDPESCGLHRRSTFVHRHRRPSRCRPPGWEYDSRPNTKSTICLRIVGARLPRTYLRPS